MGLGSLEVMVKKLSSWVNFGCILKDGEEKEMIKKLPNIYSNRKNRFSFFLCFVFIWQAVPGAVIALQCCFQHIWFVHAAIQGVTVAKAHVSLPPRLHSSLSLVVVKHSNGSSGHTQMYSQPPGELYPWNWHWLRHRAVLIYLFQHLGEFC